MQAPARIHRLYQTGAKYIILNAALFRFRHSFNQLDMIANKTTNSLVCGLCDYRIDDLTRLLQLRFTMMHIASNFHYRLEVLLQLFVCVCVLFVCSATIHIIHYLLVVVNGLKEFRCLQTAFSFSLSTFDDDYSQLHTLDICNWKSKTFNPNILSHPIELEILIVSVCSNAKPNRNEESVREQRNCRRIKPPKRVKENED